ncbi:hypothetical protein E4K64_05525 [Bradyrhizobium frederickii]|uniref:Uncharacterized protein n=1 Tax=Bradyrhizobium frederickii TaxID=2560054 RepID=A0A4Y9PI17_9BRAD|nr:hypothetical protein [Bradyrhizobium frederickii]TFV78646.1 hypothetical protein E4K64_05525 [Bradyrhizobium frederickii]
MTMLPVVERGQSMDGTLAQLVGIALAVACSLHNSPGYDLSIYLKLADVLKRSTRQLVRRVHGGYLLRVNGQAFENRIDTGHNAPHGTLACDARYASR